MAVENMTLAPFYSNGRNPFNYVKIEQISRDVSTAWLTLEEITQQLNLFDDESQDSYLSGLELAVRMAIEDYLGMSIFMTQYRIYYANPGLYNTNIYLDLPEVGIGRKGITINSVVYYPNIANPTDCELVTMASTEYYYDVTGNRIIINNIQDTLNQNIDNPIVVTYTVNANPLASYPVIKQAGLLLFTHLYNNRSNSVEKALSVIPYGVDMLLRPYKTLVM
jgi:hypothetical protein